MKFAKLCCAVSALAVSFSVSAQDGSQDAEETAQSTETAPPPVTVRPVASPPPESMKPVPVPPPAPPVLRIPPPAPMVSPAPPAPPPPAPPSARISRLTTPPPTDVMAPYPANQLAATNLIGREKKLEWFQAPAVFLPGLTEPGRERVVENTVLLRAPLHWAISARLKGDVTIAGVGDPIELKDGDILPQVILRDGRGFDDRFTLFCTRSRIHQKSSGLDIMGSIINSMKDAQWCLQDSDSDGTLDLAVVLAAGAPIKKAQDITPIPYEVRYGQQIPGDDSFVSFAFNHVGRKDVGLGLAVFQAGEAMVFDTLTSGVYRAKSQTMVRHRDVDEPTANILGIKFRVHYADRKENLAEIEWEPGQFNRSAIITIPWRLTTTYY